MFICARDDYAGGMSVTPVAPAPPGYLHLGHAYSALRAWRFACETDGRFLLRIEDIDQTRCRPEFTEAIYEDLAWLGISWGNPVRCQSQHLAEYARQLEILRDKELLYPCFCTRADIARSPSAPHGPDGALYPGTCKHICAMDASEKMASGKSFAWRLHTDRALCLFGDLFWHDTRAGVVKAQPELLGDIVLARKETPTSYHVSVTVDDGLQGVTDIIRGEDLFHATHIHVLLQTLLGFPVPTYQHHPLLAGPDGKRFAKRDGAVTIRALRESGKAPADILQIVGLA